MRSEVRPHDFPWDAESRLIKLVELCERHIAGESGDTEFQMLIRVFRNFLDTRDEDRFRTALPLLEMEPWDCSITAGFPLCAGDGCDCLGKD